jgi:alpha-tubulin suppressor-like RCC1 family protein
VGYSGYGPAPTSIQGPTELRGNNNFPYYWYPWTNQGYTGPGWDVPVGSHSDVIYEYSLYNQFYIWGTDPGLYLGATPAPSQIPLQFSSGYLPQGQVISSAVAYHALLVDPSANLWAWGRNSSGQLGQNSTSPLAGYWQVSFSEYPAPILKAATGAAHSLALDASNNLWAWGNNASGQLGLSGGDPVNTTNAYVPMQVSANLAYSEAWTACAAGTDFSVGLTTHGVWVWGANEHGQIGLESGPDANLYVPTKLSFYEGTFYGTAILQVAAGAEHILALDANGNVWTWGAGQLGQLGTGSIGDSSYPAPVLGPQSDFDQTVSSYPIVQICAGANFCLALDSAGNLWGWGDGATGALPTGNTPQVLTVATQLSIPFTAVWVTATADSVVAVDQYGDFWTWGWNQGGGLGADPNDPYSYAYVAAPTPISLAAPPYDYIPGD